MIQASAPTPTLLSKSDLEWLRPARLRYKLVTESGAWLDTCYECLCRHFGPEVLDPLERFVEWLDLNRRGVHPFPFLLMAVYVVEDSVARVIGVISGNVMRIERSRPEAAESEPAGYFFALGNQLTDPLVRQAGIKGVGTKLWRRSVAKCKSIAAKLGGPLAYSFLEAENDSVGFWDRLGYRWPQDVTYWQPPLEFDDHGDFLHPEVPEIAMFKPLEVRNKRTIERQLLLDVIATVFRNWALHRYRATLSRKAMKRAERYVMGSLLGRVESRMPLSPQIRLVRVRAGRNR